MSHSAGAWLLYSLGQGRDWSGRGGGAVERGGGQVPVANLEDLGTLKLMAREFESGWMP